MSCGGCSFAGQSTAVEDSYVGVRFGEETNLTLCATGGLHALKGARVVVATDHGPAVGMVEKSPMPVFKPCQKTSARQILRGASREDLAADEKRLANELRAKRFCRERARELGLSMKISRVDFTLDGRKAVFTFTADGRVDFRQLVRDLSRRFETRVRMVQVGARDEAKLLGGVGICGRTLCCSSWLGEFRSISIQMAKRQGLSLNPSKISGQCGRLLCCLKYEDDQYKQKGHRGGRGPRPSRNAGGAGGRSSAPSRNPVRLRPPRAEAPPPGAETVAAPGARAAGRRLSVLS